MVIDRTEEELELKLPDLAVFSLSCVHSICKIKWQNKVARRRNLELVQSPGWKPCILQPCISRLLM